MKIKIDGTYYANFQDFAFEQSLDTIAATFSFTCRFDQEKRFLFKPLLYKKVQFYDNDNKLFFTGVIIDHGFISNSEGNLIQLSGYSLPGVLEDCTIPFSSYPLESNNMNLKEIITKFIKPFGLNLVIDSSAENETSKNYTKSSATPEQSLKDYFSKLAAQRNVILTTNLNGDLLIFKPDINKKISYVFNKENTFEISLNVSGQGMHSEITNLRQPKPKKTVQKKRLKNSNPGELDDLGYPISSSNPLPVIPKPKKVKEKPRYHDSIENPLVSVFRPIVQVLTEGEDYATENAAKNQLAEEMKNIKISILLKEWIELKPADIIEVQNNEIYFEEKIKLIVQTVRRSESSTSREMNIDAVPLEAFTGNKPKNIFL